MVSLLAQRYAWYLNGCLSLRTSWGTRAPDAPRARITPPRGQLLAAARPFVTIIVPSCSLHRSPSHLPIMGPTA
ncbi:hypothetical protein AUW26_30935 [Streptomyces sp. CC71]|nr:hypothetical protein AUW26_30935 [Streptomyces sp. CC71]